MENKNPRHLFHKLFLSYSAVLILIVGVLILFLFHPAEPDFWRQTRIMQESFAAKRFWK